MVTIGLYNFIKILNFTDDDFAKLMGQTKIGNTNLKVI